MLPSWPGCPPVFLLLFDLKLWLRKGLFSSLDGGIELLLLFLIGPSRSFNDLTSALRLAISTVAASNNPVSLAIVFACDDMISFGSITLQIIHFFNFGPNYSTTFSLN